jgi:hypothetical protein
MAHTVFYLSSHGISPAWITVLFEKSRRVFNLIQRRLIVHSTWTVVSPTCSGKDGSICNFIMNVNFKVTPDFLVQTQRKGRGTPPNHSQPAARREWVVNTTLQWVVNTTLQSPYLFIVIVEGYICT